MTDQPLEEQIAQWRAYVRRRQALHGPDVEELEGHLRDQLAALETHAKELPAVDVLSVPARTYPFGKLGAHAVGYLNEISGDELGQSGSGLVFGTSLEVGVVGGTGGRP